MKMLKIAVATVACACAGGSVADTPINYWAVKGGADALAAGNLKLDDGSVAAWTNGNILISGSTGYPSTIGNADYRNLSISADISVYGAKYKSGNGGWGGKGKLTIGAGGIDATSSWDRYFSLACPVHLAADQTWTHPCGVSVGAALTAEDGVTWTLTSSQQSGLGRIGLCVTKANTLSGVTVVLKNSERFSLRTANASICADVLRLEGSLCKLYYDNATDIVLDRRYAKTLELKDGAIPTFFTIRGKYASAWGDSETYSVAKTNVVYDIDAMKVLSGETKLGDGFAYSIKDGAALPVTVESGATLTLTKVPTEGSLKILGSGILNTSQEQFPKLDLTEFVGTIRCGVSGIVSSLAALLNGADAELIDAVLRIDSVAGYAGTLTLSGSTRVALPRTADWPDGMRVVVTGSAYAYLPQGEAVDTAKISGNHLAVGRGQSEETETVTLASGETLVICGDGFGAEASIVLAGGKLEIPFDATFSSPVHVTAASYVAVSNCATAKASGAWSIDAGCTVYIDNASFTKSGTSYHGRLAFTGTGTAEKNASDTSVIRLRGGELTFEGSSCEWNLPAGCSVTSIESGPKYVGILNGAKLNFEADPTYNYYRRSALSLAGSAADTPVLEINTGSVLSFGEYRGLTMGCGSWRNHTTLKVNGGTLKMSGSYAIFCKGDMYPPKLKNNGEDRSGQLDIYVTNGGVIETDRSYTSNPVSHVLDITGFTVGTFMTIDGGTYRVGTGFGIGTGTTPNNTAHSYNALFGAVDDANYYNTTKPKYTCEIKITVGENGALFDLSRAKAGANSISNTIPGKCVANANFPNGYIPTRGPQWEINGPLTVKGNGTQEFVMNGITNSDQITSISADGVVVKLTGDFDGDFDAVTLGASGSGVKVEETNGTVRAVAVAALNVAEGGSFDARCFNCDETTVGTLTFGSGATLVCPAANRALVQLKSIGSVALADQMTYFCSRTPRIYGVVLHADDALTPEGGSGVKWSAADGSTARAVSVSGTDITFGPRGTVLFVR